jgi:Ca2+/Na+ antiporter
MAGSCPYGCYVDRVDRWLNAQRGWRRLLTGWLFLAPAAVNAGLLWSSWGNANDQGTVATGSVLLRIAVAVLAAVPLAAVLMRLQLRRLRSRPWEPRFSWRMFVAMYVFMTGVSISVYGDTRTLAWRQRHPSYNTLYLADAVFIVLLIWNGLYYRELRRRAAAEAQAAVPN